MRGYILNRLYPQNTNVSICPRMVSCPHDVFIIIMLMISFPQYICRVSNTLPVDFDHADHKELYIADDFAYPAPLAIIKYALQPLNIVDLVAIIPFYLSIVFGTVSHLSIIRILRLARIIRLLKGGKGNFEKGLRVVMTTVQDSIPMFMFLLFVALLIFLICGSVEYLLEGGNFKVNSETPNGAYYRRNLLGNDDEITPFQSVLHGLYWSVITSTTVGYGDLYPTSPAGRICGSVCALLGIVVLALPITVVSTQFAKNYDLEFLSEKPSTESLEISKDADVKTVKEESPCESSDVEAVKESVFKMTETVALMQQSLGVLQQQLEAQQMLLDRLSVSTDAEGNLRDQMRSNISVDTVVLYRNARERQEMRM